MKIKSNQCFGDASGRGHTGVRSLVVNAELPAHSPLALESDPLRTVWWVNMVCLAIFSVGIIGAERVMPFSPRAIASEPLAQDFPPLENSSDNPLESAPGTESQHSEEREPVEAPRVPEPILLDGFGVGGPENPNPLPVLKSDGENGPRRIDLQTWGGGMGGQKGKAKPEEFTGRGKRGKQGYVPEPDVLDMPRALQEELPRGQVTMRLGFRVSPGGTIVEIHVDQSSGNVLLDRFIQEWYKRKGTFVGGPVERVFVETLSLRLPE